MLSSLFDASWLWIEVLGRLGWPLCVVVSLSSFCLLVTFSNVEYSFCRMSNGELLSSCVLFGEV